jgi:hypothetical protein
MARRKVEAPKGSSTEKMLPLNTLRPHPRNYRKHPEDQIAHLQASLSAYGFFRRIVVANDGTILAGHGIAQAASALSREVFERVVVGGMVPVIQFPFGPNDPRALKLVAVDNEIGRFAEVDDRALTELLRDIHKEIDGLMGTGYDEKMLAALAMVTRPDSEIASFDAAAEWVGLPEFNSGNGTIILSIRCLSVEVRNEALAKLGLDPTKCKTVLNNDGNILSTWLPPKENDDLKSLAWKEKKR